ncbi:uncharacterized protein Chchd3 isoform X2 [Panulirus ornatus]|uniref:uncharacterized protein Chchd3 isoform X2 n=1 Tax=Panulirus ornatus TaxID=150431 RepID=UPI003A8BDF1B
MGAAQSTRKITLVNDDKAGVIKLSESLAYRLRGQIEGQQGAAEVPGPAAEAEPLPTPTPVPVTQDFTPSEVSVPSSPIPQVPETPKIPDIAPVPETAAPEPTASETNAPEPSSQKPLTSGPPVHEPPAPESVVSEPLAPESLVAEPTAAGESHPLADVPVDTPSPTLIDVSEPSPSVLPSVAEYADPQPSALEDNISKPQEITEIESFEPQVSVSFDESSTSSSESQSPSTEIVDPPVTLPVEEEAAVAATAVVEQVQLPTCETLLAAAFPIDEASPVAESTPDTSGPPVVESIETLPSLALPLVVEEAVPSDIAKELLVAVSPQGEQEVVPTDGAEEPTVAPTSSLPAVEPSPDVGIAIKAGPGPTLIQPAGNIPPWSIYAEEAHLMVMRLREEKEQEIKKLNLDWRDKVEAREKEFTKMARLSEEEIGAAFKDVEKMFLKASVSPVCQNQQEAVMTCYQSHPRQALRCARDVEQFTQCVNLSRLQSIMKQKAN